MQALVGLFCFSLVLATGTCLECEHCSGFQKDCIGKLKLCSKDQDTCATILTETIIGKVSSFTIIKSCYQASKCLGSNNGNAFVKVKVNIECSSSPAGKIESEGGKALDHGSNELPGNQLLAKFFSRPKSRAAEDLNTNPGNSRVSGSPKPPTDKPEPPTDKPKPPTDKPKPPTDKPKPPTDKPKPPTDKPEPHTDKPKPPTDKPKPPTDKPEPPTDKPKPPTDKPKPPTDKPKPPTDKPQPPTDKPKPPTDKPKPPTDKPKPSKPVTEKPKPTPQKTTTGDAHQTVASFLLALSSLLLMNIVL